MGDAPKSNDRDLMPTDQTHWSCLSLLPDEKLDLTLFVDVWLTASQRTYPANILGLPVFQTSWPDLQHLGCLVLRHTSNPNMPSQMTANKKSG